MFVGVSLNEARVAGYFTVHPANYERAVWLSGPIWNTYSLGPGSLGLAFPHCAPWWSAEINLKGTVKIFENSTPFNHHGPTHFLPCDMTGSGWAALSREIGINADSPILGLPKPL